MKKTLLLILSIVTLVAVTGCVSKEKKAAKLIEKELSKTLYDFDSYQPIETVVVEAKSTKYNDSACWNKAAVLAYAMEKSTVAFKEADRARENMLIWGRPTSYSSSYSDNNYHKYKTQYIEELENANSSMTVVWVFVNALHEKVG